MCIINAQEKIVFIFFLCIFFIVFIIIIIILTLIYDYEIINLFFNYG